jgi:hypothetical protein
VVKSNHDWSFSLQLRSSSMLFSSTTNGPPGACTWHEVQKITHILEKSVRMGFIPYLYLFSHWSSSHLPPGAFFDKFIPDRNIIHGTSIGTSYIPRAQIINRCTPADGAPNQSTMSSMLGGTWLHARPDVFGAQLGPSNLQTCCWRELLLVKFHLKIRETNLQHKM